MSKLGNKGQSTTEFALVLILVMSFTFYFIHLGLMLGVANYIQYVTFMASRAYFASHETIDKQRSAAETYLQRMLEKPSRQGEFRFENIIKPNGQGDSLFGAVLGGLSEYGYNPNSRQQSWAEGVIFSFKSKLFSIPFGGNRERVSTDSLSLELVSESILGREPSAAECKDSNSDNGGCKFP